MGKKRKRTEKQLPVQSAQPGQWNETPQLYNWRKISRSLFREHILHVEQREACPTSGSLRSASAPLAWARASARREHLVLLLSFL